MNHQNTNEAINFKLLYSALRRRWRYLAVGAVAGFIFTSFNLLKQKDIYQADFQIIVSEGASADSALSDILGQINISAFPGAPGSIRSSNSSSIGTQISILKSPSVLLPVFERYKELNPGNTSMRFKDWAASSVSIKNPKNTTVLNVFYQDTNKESILPLSSLISEEYQKYAFRDSEADINSSIEFLEDQIELLTPKAKDSLSRSLAYGYKYGLSFSDGAPLTENDTSPPSIRRSTLVLQKPSKGLEDSKNEAAKVIKKLDRMLFDAKNHVSQSIYVAPQAFSYNINGIEKLNELDSTLADLKSRFKSNTPSIKSLERQRSVLIKKINSDLLMKLQSERHMATLELQNLNIPQEVLDKHRVLTQNALRDQRTLNAFENKYNSLMLEKARKQKPWKLISSPTLDPRPIGPDRQKSLLTGIFTGLLLGSIVALVVDNRSRKIYSLEALEKLIDLPLIQEFHKSDFEYIEKATMVLANGVLSSFDSIAFIPMGDTNSRRVEYFLNCFRKAFGTKTVKLTNDLSVSLECSSQICLIDLSNIQKSQVEKTRSLLRAQNGHVSGFIVFS